MIGPDGQIDEFDGLGLVPVQDVEKLLAYPPDRLVVNQVMGEQSGVNYLRNPAASGGYRAWSAIWIGRWFRAPLCIFSMMMTSCRWTTTLP
jgi:hypothetical protein